MTTNIKTIDFKELQIRLKELEKELMPAWNQLKQKLPIDKVEEFGEQIKKFGTTHEIGSLLDYGDSILNAVETFDVEQIRNYVAKFPDFIDKLKNMK